MTGRTIRIHLVEGTSSGPLSAEVINWTGRILVVPRTKLSDVASRDEIRRTGVYFLAGPDPEHSTRTRVYIGESDNVLSRLVLHEKDDKKEFWTNTCIVSSKDENLTKSHVRFLESRLLQMADSANRASISNATRPPAPSMPESDVADMEYFLSQIKLVLPVLGMNFLQPQAQFNEADYQHSADAAEFQISSVGISATAREVDGEFVVLKGSTARKDGTPSWTFCRELRDDLIASGTLKDMGAHLQFVENAAFNSPSAAAAVVRAANTNGRTEWKHVVSGDSYAVWQNQKLADATANLEVSDDG